eukprot:TRINITY_DN35741_c0_g1_i1.p1 TRINITY_DN35741_c0_g1~~TRINITY_DN35741_c0_g1_i1.p1  ORF type:complete len:988 (-),score=220.37 TRINITY_DN35741_c0_g1_i1:101-3064(-)
MSGLMQRLCHKLLSQATRSRLLDEVQQNIVDQCTEDPAMPEPLRKLIASLIRIFWADFAKEFTKVNDHEEAEADALGRAEEADLASKEISAVAKGVLQVLVVEARGLLPAHGIGTNPYVRGMLGQQVKRSRTCWSTLQPAWNCLMDFPVVDLDGTLELEVMSQAPLFGGDTRLGYVSLPLRECVLPQTDGEVSPSQPSRLAYRCERLNGAGESSLVLIMDYQAHAHAAPLGRRARLRWYCCGGGRRILSSVRRSCVRFRAFFLYHYWPCDKSFCQMYLREPVDICLLLLSLSPFVFVRTIFYTVLLVCLCTPLGSPPDEHQVVHFILAFRGTAIFSEGVGRMLAGLFYYWVCVRVQTCREGSGPGGGDITAGALALALYQELLVWFVCFAVLPRSAPFRSRASLASHGQPVVPGRGAAAGDAASDTPASESTEDAASASPRATAGSSASAEEEGSRRSGGRMAPLIRYNLFCLFFAALCFVTLSSIDVILLLKTSARNWSELWTWRVRENFFWARVVFGLSNFPFLFLLHPQINKLLTHSTPTGYTRLGTLQRYKAIYRRPAVHEEASPTRRLRMRQETASLSEEERLTKLREDTHDSEHVASSEAEGAGADAAGGLVAQPDPIADLKAAIRWFPGGGLALGVGGLGLRTAAFAARTTGRIVSLEIRAVSQAVSLGMRAVDAGVSGTSAAAAYIAGSTLVVGTRAAGSTARDYAQTSGKALLSSSKQVVRQLPGGTSTLDTVEEMLDAVSFLAATAESPGLLDQGGSHAPVLKEVGERAEALKLEAAARLAEMLTRAERLAEREAAEVIERVRPEIGNISEALQARKEGCRMKLERAYLAGDSLARSLVGWASDRSLLLHASARTLLDVFARELQDLQEAGREPGLVPTLEAYSRLVVSSVCRAFLELNMPRPSKPEVAGSRAPMSPSGQGTGTSSSSARSPSQQTPLRQRKANAERARSQSPEWAAASAADRLVRDRSSSRSPSPS